MRIVGLILVFLISLIAFLIAGFPLSKALEWSGASKRGLTYQSAYGTIWSGSLTGVNVLGQPVGRVTLDTNAISLLAGHIKASIVVSGQVGEASGQIQLGLDHLTVRNFIADIDVQSLVYLDPRLRQTPSTLNTSTRVLKISYTGACLEGAAAVQSDLLTSIGRQWRWEGPLLLGDLSCNSGALDVAIQNDGGADSISAILSVPDIQSYSIRADVQTGNQDVIQALIALGFNRENNRFVYRKSSADQTTDQEAA